MIKILLMWNNFSPQLWIRLGVNLVPIMEGWICHNGFICCLMRLELEHKFCALFSELSNGASGGAKKKKNYWSRERGEGEKNPRNKEIPTRISSVLAKVTQILKLKQYKDKYGPSPRMTCKFMKHPILCFSFFNVHRWENKKSLQPPLIV